MYILWPKLKSTFTYAYSYVHTYVYPSIIDVQYLYWPMLKFDGALWLANLGSYVAENNDVITKGNRSVNSGTDLL